MLRRLTIVPVLMITLAGCQSTPQGDDDMKSAWHTHDGPYRHVVAFRFKEGTPLAKIDEINDAFAALPSKIDTITDFEWGTNESPEGLDDGFGYVYIVTFKDRAGLEEYLPHPAHQEFVALLRPHLDKPFVVDFVPKHRD